MTETLRRELAEGLVEHFELARDNVIETYFPDVGPLRRELYPKHMEFFRTGAKMQERTFLAANRSGKSTAGSFELTCHLTGIYPDWWDGHRFNRPIEAWVASDTVQSTRDVAQKILLGEPGQHGTGMVPRHLVGRVVMRGGTADAVDSVQVEHVSGGVSQLGFRSYDQGRRVFQGTRKDVIWLDEEPPLDVYSECLTRTADTGSGAGLLLATFTPLSGMSAVCQRALSGDVPSIAVVTCGWQDVPHISEHEKARLRASLPPHEREAREFGKPSLGAGAVYPISEDAITCDDFEIPGFYPMGYGLDVGWNWTAAVWGALDRQFDVLYITSVYKRGQAEPAVHASAIKSRGAGLTGAIDPAAGGRSQRDGKRLIDDYKDEGLHLFPAENAAEAGIHEVFTRMTTGRLKIFRSCRPLFEELRFYRRNDKGKVVKENDHALDALRYLVMTPTVLSAHRVGRRPPSSYNGATGRSRRSSRPSHY